MTRHTETKARLAEARDVPELKALWKTVFGDADTDIAHFFDTYFSPELTAVIGDGANPVAAAYILPAGELVLPDSGRLNCAMLYAIAAHPEYRGRGYGEVVTRAADTQAVKLGFEAVVLKPADVGLFAFYEKRAGFRAFFEAHEVEYPAAERPSDGESQYALTPATPAEYRSIRQRLLEGCAYIDTDERALFYQQYLCKKTRGGLYAIVRDGRRAGCVLIEQERNAATSGRDAAGGIVHMKELLLVPGCGIPDAISAAARLFKAERYMVRTLPDCDEKKNRRFGMIKSVNPCMSKAYGHTAKWYGPAFD